MAASRSLERRAAFAAVEDSDRAQCRSRVAALQRSRCAAEWTRRAEGSNLPVSKSLARKRPASQMSVSRVPSLPALTLRGPPAWKPARSVSRRLSSPDRSLASPAAADLRRGLRQRLQRRRWKRQGRGEGRTRSAEAFASAHSFASWIFVRYVSTSDVISMYGSAAASSRFAAACWPVSNRATA